MKISPATAQRRNGKFSMRVLSLRLCAVAGVILLLQAASAQDANRDYSKFIHSTQKHSSLACNSCHERTDNSATPRFPGHKACTDCHRSQFTTPQIPLCTICHTNVSGNNPPLKNFPASFNEPFNVKFDHAQHNTGATRPQRGCAGCHGSPINRGAGLSIPANLAAHNGCYTCHTPSSKSAAGREIASCGVCHDQKSYRPTPTNARSYRYAFSHADHGTREKLACNECHRLTAGAAQTRQVSSPTASEHFVTTRSTTCLTCHNGRRSFGGDLAFKDCKRCHTGPTFRMPM
ncbi:MAG TPA: cytochrome c3 family protein [Pyrinomonadaceae bacterium]|nr:cytochrome c3 family protein [Pyrinomonadaceae bacterium]